MLDTVESVADHLRQSETITSESERKQLLRAELSNRRDAAFFFSPSGKLRSIKKKSLDRIGGSGTAASVGSAQSRLAAARTAAGARIYF